jgi:hypothetical protein
MAFPRDEVSALLVRCHRRCCICHRFCGVKIETDHITPLDEDGDDSIENAIPVCFECHAEIHSYNDRHPRGRKFQPEEMKLHKEQWLKICDEHPEALIGAIRNADVGPLQALIDELEFNATVASVRDYREQSCRFHDQQFLRAIHEGSISLLRDTIRTLILEAYRAMGAANGAMEKVIHQQNIEQAVGGAKLAIDAALPKIQAAKKELLKFLSHDGGSEATSEATAGKIQ